MELRRLGVHWKIRLLGRGEFTKKQIEGGILWKGGLNSLQIRRGGVGKKDGGGVFEGGLVPQYTLWKGTLAIEKGP